MKSIINIRKLRLWICLSVSLLFFSSVIGQTPDHIFKAAGTPANPKVNISWNRYYTYDGITEICKKLANAHPNLVEMESIGKSYQNRDIWVLTISNLKNKKHVKKPGFWIDANIHSNEIQGSEIALYTAWYLAESYNENDFIKELLDDKVFYIAPTINPDARDHYMKYPNTSGSPRSGLVPVDDDGDGLINEDGYDDLNNDGHITRIRRRNPNGRYKPDPDDPRRMIMVGPDEEGEYELLGYEGLDNDGDGRINEDRVGSYDPNRNWPWQWQPEYIQRGSHKYPFSIPENRAVGNFIIAHPNIAGAQTYHNSGGMILRGPGIADDVGIYTRVDLAVYDAIGEKGDKLLPGYRYMVLYQDLYTVYGGSLNWYYEGRGIFSFCNELFTSHLYFHKEYESREQSSSDQYEFEKYLLFEDAFVDWEEYDHPQFGKVEIGGFKKNFGRNHPGFLLEMDAHRNMAFTLYHAYHTPKLVIEKIEEKNLGGGYKEVTVEVANKRLIPTHSSHDIKNKISRPDYISITGANVVAGLFVPARTSSGFFRSSSVETFIEQTVNPEVIKIENIPGLGSVKVRWIISGNSNYTIKVDSEKGGVVEK